MNKIKFLKNLEVVDMYYDPFDEIDKMHEEMDKIFSRFFWDKPINRPLIGHKGSNLVPMENKRAPKCHLQETETQIIATFELPGVKKSDIDLIVDDRFMELNVESKSEKKSKDKKSFSYYAQNFQRYISLPREVDSNKAKAEYKNGVLRLEVPKKNIEKSKRKKLQID
jgi:HSP20 family protein